MIFNARKRHPLEAIIRETARGFNFKLKPEQSLHNVSV